MDIDVQKLTDKEFYALLFALRKSKREKAKDKDKEEKIKILSIDR